MKNILPTFLPGNVTVDLWPDMSEATESERFATGFKHANGETAFVFSSYNRTTVLRHFKWMRDYGIDGVFVQRFANGLRQESTRHHKDMVLSSCREGANRGGRAYAVMYDLSGLDAGATTAVSDDWKMLRSRMKMGRDQPPFPRPPVQPNGSFRGLPQKANSQQPGDFSYPNTVARRHGPESDPVFFGVYVSGAVERFHLNDLENDAERRRTLFSGRTSGASIYSN